MAKIKYTGEEALARIADYVNKKLTFVSSMPESPDTNTIVLYIGASTSAYLQGGIYHFDGTDWNLINSVQTIELTKAEYDALPKEVQENGTIYFITDLDLPGSIVEGYYNQADGKFYVEDTYTTEIAGGIKIIYISLDTNMEYRYDIDEEKFVQIAGSGSSAEYTAGRGIEISTNKEISVNEKFKTTFIGTTDEWNALTDEEKAKYDLVSLTDDSSTGDVVDEVTNGEMKPVTSNAVYNAIQSSSGGVGKQLEEGSTVYIDDQGTTATVGKNAEIFNDYRDRTYSPGGALKGNLSYGNYSHAEGGITTAGDYAHAEGYTTIASGKYAHAEGLSSKATEVQSHAEGYITTASGSSSHSEGWMSTAEGQDAHAEGYKTSATGSDSHAEGYQTTASGDRSHAEGSYTKASGYISHAEGVQTESSGFVSHAEGSGSIASNDYSHAEGNASQATGKYSHAEGSNTIAKGESSHAEGRDTRASGNNQHAQGHFNKESTSGSTSGTTGDAFIIGNGTSSSRSNCFRVTFAGAVYGLSAFNSSGADYAEFFEWKDGNINNEDRVGYFVTLDNDKIKKANQEDYILGVVSGHPSIVGNGDEDWLGRYIKDNFGRTIEEDIIDEETGEVIGKTFKQNPDYDANQIYIERKNRKEWDYIGMLGTLAVRDDGTCKVNSFCKVADGGIATKSDSNEGYRVIKRISDNIIQIIFK